MPASNEARVRVDEKKKSIARTLVPQERVRDPEGPLPLELEGDLEDGVDLLLRPFLEADQVAAAKVRLHGAPTPLRRG
jgi:hypothetical protein